MADEKIAPPAELSAAPAGEISYPDEKAAASAPEGHFDDSFEETGDVVVPDTWKYRARKIGPVTIPWYASPKVQLGMVALVCFLCPGMFNALGATGGGGKADPTTADNMVSL